MRRGFAVAAVVSIALAFAAAAHAKLTLQFDRATARPGDRVTLTFGEYFASRGKVVHVYLVRASILGNVVRPQLGGGAARLGPPPRIAGVYTVGKTTSDRARFAFRVPRARTGRYAAVIWCPACRSPYLLAAFQGGIPDDAYVRPTRALLRVTG
jgi:hypothetical protein